MYVLIIITYLGGSAWGPHVAMQEFTTQSSCDNALKVALNAIDSLNKTNLISGRSSREIVHAECVKK
jgi:hypothetical protein